MDNEKELTQSKIMKALDWAYDKAVNGVCGLDSAVDIAQDYLRGDGTLRDKVNRLIRWQNCKAGTSGFLTGVGGVLTIPVTLPANITSVLYVQIRMIAAIAKMGGYDLKDDRVKSLVYICLVATSGTEVVKHAGIKIGEKITINAIKSISRDVLRDINHKVGFKLVTKFGEKGVINFGKMVPVIGGAIGATVDAITTNKVGNVARDTFIPN